MLLYPSSSGFICDNCCFKDNKVYALDIRINRIVNSNLGNDKILDITLQKNYDEFMKYCFYKINSNDIPDDYKNSDHYKIWEKSIDNFKDFSDDEKMERIDHWKPYKEILRFDNVNCSSLLILSDFIYKAIKKKKDCKDIYFGESYWHILYGGGLLYKDYLKFKKENPSFW